MAFVHPATAQQNPTAPAPRRAVSVAIKGPPEETRVLEDTIRELLARLQLTVIAAPTGGTSSLLASVEVDMSSSAEAHVVVHGAAGTPVIDRVVTRGSTAAIQREQIAHAVRGAAEAELLADEDRVAGRAPPVPSPSPVPPPAEPPPPPPPPPVETPPVVVAPVEPAPAKESPTPVVRSRALALDLATLAGAGLVARDAGPVARVGGAVVLASRGGWRPSIAFGVLYAFPFEAGSDTLASRARVLSFRLMPGIELLRSSRFALDVGGGGGIDILTVEPASKVLPASVLAETTTRGDPILSASITGRFALASDVVLTLTALSDFDLASRRYMFDDRGQRSEVLAPWSARPTLLAGLSFTALGSAPFEPKGRP